ncbi:uncharacterized protein V1516DRAFT_672561 [Lipomyces oligophaga]|uniref:uncharacterized protein n=1 Tax=Lipomyces oligophaga TaxID=45792 RepID=UPI0034CF4417
MPNQSELLPFSHNASRLRIERISPSSLATRKRDYPTSESLPDFMLDSLDSATDADDVMETSQTATRSSSTVVNIDAGGSGPEQCRPSAHSAYFRTPANIHKRLQQEQVPSDDLQSAWDYPPSSPPADDIERSFIEAEGGVDKSRHRSPPLPDLSFNRRAGSLKTKHYSLPSRAGSLGGRAGSLPVRGSGSSSFIIPPEPTAAIRQALEIIREAVESGRGDNIDLARLGISEVPEEIKDLRNIVRLAPGFDVSDTGPFGQDVRIFLGYNHLTIIPPSLLCLENLTVLSLRNNKIKTIPNAIGRLKNLSELHLSVNEISWLPAQVLGLVHLHLLALHPNPFDIVPEGGFIRERSSDVHGAINNKFNPYRSQVGLPVFYSHERSLVHKEDIWHPESVRIAPSLKELCLRSISRYRATSTEIAKWELSDNLMKQVEHAFQMASYENNCGFCGHYMVYSEGHVMEWWNSLVGNEDVPIRREFCCRGCILKWRETLSH